MYLAIIILPLLGSIASGFFGRKIGVSGAQYITCISVIATTFLATVSFFEVGLNSISVSIPVFRWLDSESLNVSWSFNFDSLTVSMLIPVLIVSSLVHMYSIGYMSHDPHNQRFFSYLSLFTFMMIILVTANNYLLMFVGWEGVGVCSYLLVSFWFTRIAANQSSMSAFLTNRVGDCFLTLGMFCMLWTFGNLDYSTVFSLAPYINGNIVTIIGICLLIGAMAKSSQIGLHVWLPLAMEGLISNRALLKFHYMRKYPKLLWSTQTKSNCLLGKIQCKGQSARNSMGSSKGALSINTSLKHIGSSETTRETNNSVYLKKINKDFKLWLVGFSEGDGCFSVYKQRYVEFKITQSSNDAQVLFFIKKTLGFGSVSIQDKTNKTHQYRVRHKQGLLKIIELFNGKVKTESKSIKFRNWIRCFNEIHKENVVFYENVSPVSLNDAWLSGFTDAEGCFTVSTFKSPKGKNTYVTVRYVLSQKGEYILLNDIAALLGGRVHEVRSYMGHNMVVNSTKLKNTIMYFSKYKLKTKKQISYSNWLKVHSIVTAKKHLTVSGLKLINSYKVNINK